MVPHRGLIDHFPGNGKLSLRPEKSDISELLAAFAHNPALLAVLFNGRSRDKNGLCLVFNEVTHSHFLLSQPDLPDFLCRQDCQLKATNARDASSQPGV